MRLHRDRRQTVGQDDGHVVVAARQRLRLGVEPPPEIGVLQIGGAVRRGAVGHDRGLAERLRERPLSGLRVLLVSCGAEEVLQGGIYGFAKRHFPRLDRERTWMLNLDTVGSPELVLIEGEGPFVMEDYYDRRFRDLVAKAAERVGHPIRRGLRSRASSDSVIPSRAGYPTAMLSSFDRHKCLSNYHQMTDTPENLDYETVARAVVLTEAVARELADAH